MLAVRTRKRIRIILVAETTTIISPIAKTINL
jgi:hypothetical protein